MNKKILIISIVAVFMLLALSFASTVSSNTSKPIRKESPLFGIRTRQAIKEKIGQVIENIKAKYIGERVFFLPFQSISLKQQNYQWTKDECETELKCTAGTPSCFDTYGCKFLTCVYTCKIEYCK